MEDLQNLCELTIKNALSDSIYKIYRQMNTGLAVNTPFKIVVGGGSAIGIYFKEDLIEVFKTHDFDTRIVDDRITEPIQYNDSDYAWLASTTDQVMTYLQTHLNNQGPLVQDTLRDLSRNYRDSEGNRYVFEILRYDRPPGYFGPSDRGFTSGPREAFQKMWGNTPNYTPGRYLCTLQYKCSITKFVNGVQDGSPYVFIDSLVDLVPYGNVPHLKHFGEPKIDKLSQEQLLENSRINPGLPRNAGKLESYFKLRLSSQGDFSNIIADINPDGPLYYASLGYVIWDTVRMVNVSFLDNGSKLKRYLNKYLYILRALTSLKTYGHCKENSFAEFVNVCNQERRRRGAMTQQSR